MPHSFPRMFGTVAAIAYAFSALGFLGMLIVLWVLRQLRLIGPQIAYRQDFRAVEDYFPVPEEFSPGVSGAAS